MNWPSYHVWLTTAGAPLTRFAQAIDQLASELGGPRFEPHITLISDVAGSEPELVQRTQVLAQQLAVLDLRVARVTVGNEYFRCIYAQLENSPALAQARSLALQSFGQQPKPFLPHVSLAYGDYLPARKTAAIAALPAGLIDAFQAPRLTLLRADSADPAHWFEVCSPMLNLRTEPR